MDYMTVLWSLFLVQFGLIQGFLVDDLNSCRGRCGAGLDKAYFCQCNSQCLNYNDCCQDHSTLCGTGESTTCGTFGALTQKLWDNDVNRLSTTDVRVNPQGFVRYDDFKDMSSQKLFSYVDERKLNSAVYKTFLDLLDNHNPDKYVAEQVTSQERAEEDAFLDALMATSTLKTLYDYLHCQGKVRNMSDLKSELRRFWFDLYARSSSSSALDTNGFEHVFVGEFKSSSGVNGLHSWLAFYEKEKRGEIEYYGHSCTTHRNNLCAAFVWDGRTKTGSSFFLRTSPAFDVAVYTACFMFYPGQVCPAVIDGSSINIKTYSTQGHVATAYIAK